MIPYTGDLKVLEHTDASAKIYYVGKERCTGNIVCFHKNDEENGEESWNTIYSKSGSADEMMWPYWWLI